MNGHPEPSRLSDFDALGDLERRELLDHVADCGRCRSIWAGGDPSRLFALLEVESVPGTVLDGLSARVNDEIDSIELESRGRRRGFGWASLAASVLLTALIGGYLISRPDVGSGPIVAGTAEERHDEFAGSGIEVMTPADADVYDLTVGDTQIVMIFDERLDI
jgi:hypothetical protein